MEPSLSMCPVGIHSLSLTLVVPSASRAHLRVDLQRVPDLRTPGQPPLRFTRDWEFVHRKGGSFGRGQLHVCGDEHGDQQQGPGPPHPAHPPERR